MIMFLATRCKMTAAAAAAERLSSRSRSSWQLRGTRVSRGPQCCCRHGAGWVNLWQWQRQHAPCIQSLKAETVLLRGLSRRKTAQPQHFPKQGATPRPNLRPSTRRLEPVTHQSIPQPPFATNVRVQNSPNELGRIRLSTKELEADARRIKVLFVQRHAQCCQFPKLSHIAKASSSPTHNYSNH